MKEFEKFAFFFVLFVICFVVFTQFENKKDSDICFQYNIELNWACLDGCYNALLIVFNETQFEYDAPERGFYDKCAERCGDIVDYESCQNYLK